MQKLIAKYGTAAHLALLAVAPLFLFPFFGEAVVATAILWLSVPAFSWVLFEPSVRSGEILSQARRRVLRAILLDPLFWASLFILLLAGIRALNGGVALIYDAEVAKWTFSAPVLPILPGCVTGAGFLPFAALVAGAVLMQGCRHALGRSARMSFLFVSSVLAGAAAVVAVLAGHSGNMIVRTAMAVAETESFYVGVAFFLHLLGGTVALYAAFERGWKLMMPFSALSIGGTAAAGFLYSPPIVSLVFLSAEVLLIAYVFFCSVRTLAASGEFKLLVAVGLAFVLGGLLLMSLEPDTALLRVASFAACEFLTDSFVSLRDVLSGVALRSWLSNLWLGTGLGSFSLSFRLQATPTDWQLVRAGAQAVPNGWWLLLSERGIVGAVIVGLTFGFLTFTYIYRLVSGLAFRVFPHPACCLGPFVLVTMAVTGLYGCALFRADVMMIALAMLAISANSFPRGKRMSNG